MDNPEYTFQILEVFSKIKTKEIPRELEEYISYVARTGNPVFQWSLVKVLIKEKLMVVLDEFMDGNANLEIPQCPNVDPFSFESMKSNLLSRLDSFVLPPFTIQRICELLTAPRKEYNRLDKYMRAVEKNVLVVSASDLTVKRAADGDNNDAVINGILYDKVNDSLNVSNHVFSGEEADSELSVSSKLDETDAVQQMIEESWNDDNHDEFKLNGGPANSSLGENFENELQFVAGDKQSEERNSSDVSLKEDSDSSFGSNSMLLDSSLQNIIGESSNITFESVPKSEESFESKNDDTYEFRSDSICENELSSTSEKEVESTFRDKSDNPSQVDDENVSTTVAADLSNILEKDDVESDKSELSVEFVITDTKTDDVAGDCQVDTEKGASFEYVDNANNEDSSCDDRNASVILGESDENIKNLSDVQNVIDENVEPEEPRDPSVTNGIENSSIDESKDNISSMETDEVESGLSCGDNEHIQNAEENVSPGDGVVETPCEQTQPEATE